MKQHSFENNILTLYVKQSPILIRWILYLLTVLAIVIPVAFFIHEYMDKGKVDTVALMALPIFLLISLYFLRMSLWNTWGSETIKFEDSKIHYSADYKWFKDGAVDIENYSNLKFVSTKVNGKNSSLGAFSILGSNAEIHCVTNIELSEIDEIIEKVQKVSLN